MTTTPQDALVADDTDREFATHAARRHVRLAVALGAGALVVVLAVTALLVLRHQDGEYGPISAGSAGGLGPGPYVVDDDAGSARLATRGDATAFVFSTLANEGKHSVKVIRIERDRITVAARWAPYATNGETMFEPARWLAFPAVVPANSEIQVRYEIRRPSYCRDKPMTPDAGSFYGEDHVVHWESLLADHATTVRGRPVYTVQVC